MAMWADNIWLLASCMDHLKEILWELIADVGNMIWTWKDGSINILPGESFKKWPLWDAMKGEVGGGMGEEEDHGLLVPSRFDKGVWHRAGGEGVEVDVSHHLL